MNEKKSTRRQSKEEQEKEIREDEHEEEPEDIRKYRATKVLCLLSGKVPEETKNARGENPMNDTKL